jgi:predicted nucleic acid-binding Zn ribbon protein
MAKKRPGMRRPAPVSDLLSAFLRGTPAEKRLKEGGIWLIWADAVGSRIASHAAPVSFRDGALTVAVDSAPWLQQLTFLKGELIGKLNEKLGEPLVAELHLKAGVIPRPEKPRKKAPKKHRLSEEELALVQKDAEEIADPELRAVFASLMKKNLEFNGDR